jgi:DNA-binding transcriptional LysR family regulator
MRDAAHACHRGIEMPTEPAAPRAKAPVRWPLNLSSRLDFVTLKLFVATVEEQSIAKAAQREFIAPSAASKRIADLEHATQAQLLSRHRKGISPTPAGEAFLQHARAILRDMAQLEAHIGDFSTGARGHVRIATSESALYRFVPDALSSFAQQYPQIRIDLKAEVSTAVIPLVQENATDIGIFWGELPTPELHAEPCYSDRLMVAMPRDHELSARASVRYQEVLEFEVIEQEANSSMQALLLREANLLGMVLRSRIRVGGYDAACSMAVAGFGLAIIPDSFTQRMQPGMGLVLIPLDEPWATRQYKICTRATDYLPTATRLLMEHFLSCAAAKRPADAATPPRGQG